MSRCSSESIGPMYVEVSGRSAWNMPGGRDFLWFQPSLDSRFLQAQLIQNLWNLLELNKIWMECSVKLDLFLGSWQLECEIMAVNTPPSLNFCSSSSKAQTEARWIRSCVNVHTLQVPCAQQLIPYVLSVSWLIPKVLEDGAYSFIIPRSWAVEGLNNLDRNVFYCLFRFLARSFARLFFQKRFRFPQWYSRVTQGVWSSHGVGVLTLFFLLLRLICGVHG